MKHLAIAGFLAAAAWTGSAATDLPAELNRCNIIWTNQSTGAVDSMPLAGGVLGLNVWVENDDLFFLMGSPNCMDENGMQTKLGRVRLRFSPAAFAKNFRQELDLARSEMIVSGETVSGKPLTVRLWCDVFQPVIHAAVVSDEPVQVSASYETWSNFNAKFVDGGVQWARRLPDVNPRRVRDMKAQGMDGFAAAVPDPLSRLTAGGRLLGDGLEPDGLGEGTFHGMKLKTCSLKTARPVKKLDLRLVLRMEQDPTLEDWETQLDRAAKASSPRAREASLNWWKEFWNRSHIIINPAGNPNDRAWQAGRNYQLCRYMLAANRNGRAMTLFNGGVFACTGNPDARNWDGCQFMGQNQRLVYWPMLRAGDFDLLQVALDFYRDRETVSRVHAKKFWNVDGVAWPEPFSIFGLDAIGTTPEGRSAPDHLHYHYTSGMEFALMMLDFERYSGQTRSNYQSAAEGIITYYDQFYQQSLAKKTGRPLDAAGRLVIYPSDACEPYHGCTNNTDVLAGLTALSRALLELPEGRLTPERRKYLVEFQKRIPPFPIKTVNGKTLYAAAESWEWVFYNGNMDFPQMYVCFPFNIAVLGRPEIELAGNTWDLGPIKPEVQRQNQCWYQSAINLARLGRTPEAAQFTARKLLHPGARFPTFYRTHYAGGGGDFCHLPDTDHAGCSMIALQEMLMQTDGRRILLGPAWPAEWDCNFKLCAPYQTAVEGRIVKGKVLVDRVTPKSRRADIEIFPLKEVPEVPVPVSEGKAATASSTYNQPGYHPGRAVDGDPATRWASASEARQGWLQVDLGAEKWIRRAFISEIEWPETREFALEYKAGDTWRELARGTAIGAEKRIEFAPVRAQYFRLNVFKSERAININEFQLFEK